MTLNEKIGVILKQHKEGEEFFNALDFMILLCKNWIFIDDSYYLGRTRAGISVALRKIRPDASIFETYVIYDGSMGRADKVKSMYRYNR